MKVMQGAVKKGIKEMAQQGSEEAANDEVHVGHRTGGEVAQGS